MARQLAAGRRGGRGKARGERKNSSSSGRRGPPRARVRGPRAEREEAEQADETTRKYGLEAGLWSVFRSPGSSQSRAEQAKELLKRYGSAYLATSITLSLISFSLFYALIAYGVDVSVLLGKIGLTVRAESTTEKVGTAALAYAAHKAASPIRFPPTVALTPVVAQWLGKKPESEAERESSNDSSSQ